ncbi:MAG: diguanylate cyclase [Rubrivivax sp. SCN 71-131]|jgi:GAF domain-containing protein|nr:MAG: diguanylate cyclase [Rubrivivax sp. SCN 71-131]
MFHTPALDAPDKPGQYAELAAQLRGLLHGERNRVANAANFAALVYHALPGLNWCGVYFVDAAVAGGELVLGPFQGKPACVRIAFARGVCGTAAATRTTQLVPDVNAFPGHIACDSASRSELVVPLVRADGTLLGVWDVDSPLRARFDERDRAGMQSLCAIFLQASDG